MMSLPAVGSAAVIGTLAGCFAPILARASVVVALGAEGVECDYDDAATLYQGKSALIALAVGILVVASVSAFGWTVKGVFIAMFLFALVVLSLIDFSTLLLPDVLTIPLAFLGVGVNAFAVVVPFREAIFGAETAVLCFWLLHWAIYKCSGREGMGLGDVKLYCALGAWLGYKSLLHVLVLALMLAALYGVWLIAMRRVSEDRMIPFGPFLAAGAAVTALVGTPLYAIALS